MKKKVLVDVKISCDPPRYVGTYCNTQEDYAKELESWVKEFHAFIRDHRSQDPVYLNVEREYQDQCSFCNREWETEEDGCPCCCQEAVNEFESNKKQVAVSM